MSDRKPKPGEFEAGVERRKREEAAQTRRINARRDREAQERRDRAREETAKAQAAEEAGE